MQPNLAAVAATVAATIAPCIHSLCFGGTALYTQISHTNRKDEVKDEEFQLLAAVMMLLSLSAERDHDASVGLLLISFSECTAHFRLILTLVNSIALMIASICFLS